MNITQMKEGKKGKVVEIAGGRCMVAKLDALGIRTGVEITKMSSQIFGGPVIVQVGNTQVAIGRGMTQRIMVEVKD